MTKKTIGFTQEPHTPETFYLIANDLDNRPLATVICYGKQQAFRWGVVEAIATLVANPAALNDSDLLNLSKNKAAVATMLKQLNLSNLASYLITKTQK